jgi:hypothetical protein
MKKFISFLFVGLLGLIILPKTIFAMQYDNLIELPVDDAQQQELEALEVSELIWQDTQGEILGVAVNTVMDEDIDYGPHFYFGEELTVEDDLVGDVYVAGGNVRVNGVIDGDLMVAGGTVTLNGEVTQDVRVAGGEIYVNGIIGDNLTIAGGSIQFSPEAMVGNSIVAGGGNVNLDGETVGRVLLGGGAAQIAGKYGSDVNAQADTISILPGVVIDGSLIADAGLKADVSDEAEIMGEQLVTITPVEERERVVKEAKMKSVGGLLVKATLIEFFMKLAMGIVSGSILIYFLPKFVEQVSKGVLEVPVANAGWGLVYLFITPIVILLSMISIVALPVAGIITLVYILSIIIAQWTVAYALGIKLAKNLKVKAFENKYLGFAVGLLVLNAVGFVPILGWLVKMIAFFIGMGAIFSIIRTNILTKKK